MAASNFFTYPLDVPHIGGPGFVHRTAMAPGNDSHQYIPPEHPIRREKGDIGMSEIKDFTPRALTSGGTPWKSLKGGR
jgi:hypothetical protein